MRIISGIYGRRQFQVPRNITARPTTDYARENIFNVIGRYVDLQGARCLDLFAGTGAVTFELLSRGAASVTAVEYAKVQNQFIDFVADKLGCKDRLNHIRGDVFRILPRLADRGERFDFIFADPPYDLPDFDLVVPAVLDSGLLAPGGLFIIEHSAKRSYTDRPEAIDHRAYGAVNFTLLSGSDR